MPRGEVEAAAVLAAARSELDGAGIEPEYLELRSTTDLSPVERVNGSTLLAVAAHVGRARLIDNTVLTSTATGSRPEPLDKEPPPDETDDAQVQDPPRHADR